MEQSVPEAPAVKKSSKTMLIIAFVVLVAGAAGGTWYFMRPAVVVDKEKSAEAVPAAKQPAQYFALTPSFVVNLADTYGNRYLQVDINLMGRQSDFSDAISHHVPLLRHRLLMLFGQKQSTQLRSSEDKEKVQAEALEEVRTLLVQETGKPMVEALYFTSFVMQ